MPTHTVNVSELIDRRSLGRFQYVVFLLCGATLFVEGYDTQAIAYVAPALAHGWGLSRGALGPVFGAGLFGLMIGSFLIAPLADRVGRRRVILGSTLFFGCVTLLTPVIHSLPSLLVLRLITGMGSGGTMPNAVALAAEYSPERRRASVVMLVFTGFPIGSAIGGLVAARLIASYGWETVFLFGGALTLLVCLLLAAKLPESARFLALSEAPDKRLARLLAKIDGTINPERPAHYVAGEKPSSAKVADLFKDGRDAVTPLLWGVYFMSLLDLYLLASWLPTTIHMQGISVELAVVATSLLQIGGILGAIALGLAVHRFGAYRVMPAAYTVAAICIASIAFVGSSVGLTMVAVFCAGFTVIGCQNCNNGLASILYPTAIRATGVGWANAAGRIGSVIGPTVAGVMLSMDSDVRTIFLFGAVPALCAAVATGAIGRKRAGAVFADATWAASPKSK